MTWIQRLLSRRRLDRELDSELRHHIELMVMARMRSGMTEAEARREARLEFGGMEQVKEDCRESRGTMLAESILKDIQYAARQLAKHRGFAIVAILTLGFGVGANTTIFSVVDGVLLKPLPYPHSEQLVSVEITPMALDPSLRGMAAEDYFIFRDQGRTFQQIGIYAETDSDHDVNVTGFGDPERVHALAMTDGVLSSLGIPAMLGRIFIPSDDSPGAPLTAVLTYGYWQRRFNASSAAIGATIVVDGKAYQIIGVLARDFRFFDAPNLELILPLQLDPNKTYMGNFSYFGVGRLKQGITLSQASADVFRMLPIVLDSFPPAPGLSMNTLKDARMVPNLVPLKDDVVGNVGTLLWVLMGGVGAVLLMAAANVANLFLVRADGRRQEFALRVTLGASRRRVAALLLGESAIISLAGGVLGLGLAMTGLRMLALLAPAGLPRIADIRVDLATLLFTLAVTLVTCFLFGLIPVFRFGGTAPRIESGRSVSQSREHHRARNSLVTLQVALALVLLICSALMIRTLRALMHVDAGFNRPEELQVFRLSISPSEVPYETRVVRIEQQIQEKLVAIPGVSAAASGSAVPLDGDNRLDNVFAQDRAYAAGTIPPLRHLLFVSPGYLRTMGIALVAGRDLNWTDTFNRIPVALISENFAREYWHMPAEAIGKHIRVSGVDDWREVIGVAGDVHDQGMDKPARTDIYCPILVARFQGRPVRVNRYMTFVIRSHDAGSESLLAAIRQAVWSVDDSLPIAGAHTLGYSYRKSMARTSFTLVMLGIAGAMALLLATVGLYGVIAYSVSQRTREIGIRIAIGSQQRDVIRLVLNEGVRVILTGMAVGLAASVVGSRFLDSLIFGVTPTDPPTFVAVMMLLAGVGLVACYVPALRAARIDPDIAL